MEQEPPNLKLTNLPPHFGYGHVRAFVTERASVRRIELHEQGNAGSGSASVWLTNPRDAWNTGAGLNGQMHGEYTIEVRVPEELTEYIRIHEAIELAHGKKAAEEKRRDSDDRYIKGVTQPGPSSWKKGETYHIDDVVGGIGECAEPDKQD